jgi:uncharacterized protein (DUF885 family)
MQPIVNVPTIVNGTMFPFPSFANAKKHKSIPDTGTGYGGSNTDTSRLKAGRKKAVKASEKEDKANAKFLQDALKKIKKLDDDGLDDEEEKRIKSILADVFRNQIPNDWGKRGYLYDAAFDMTRFLSCERFIELFGDAEDAESVLYWLVDFGKQAEQILKHEATVGPAGAAANKNGKRAALAVNNEDDEVAFAKKVTSVRDEAVKMAKRYNRKPEEELTMISFSERYKGELGPMRFDTVDNMNNVSFLI